MKSIRAALSPASEGQGRVLYLLAANPHYSFSLVLDFVVYWEELARTYSVLL